MNGNEVLGAVLVALGTLLGLMATLNKFITQPINNLNENIIRLTARLESTDKDVLRLDKRVDRHGDRLDEHDAILARNNLM